MAGCKRTRRSTSGGVIRNGDHLIKGYAAFQAMIALSSGEADYYGMVKAASTALGIKALLDDLGIIMGISRKPDATAAKGIATRQGLGKIRHFIDIAVVAPGERSLGRSQGC